MTQQAADALKQLDVARLTAVSAALENLGNDPKFITSAVTGGHAYSRRRLKDYGLQIIYRQLDKTSENEPDRYLVIAIEGDEHP
jgi:hypothetical protein